MATVLALLGLAFCVADALFRKWAHHPPLNIVLTLRWLSVFYLVGLTIARLATGVWF